MTGSPPTTGTAGLGVRDELPAPAGRPSVAALRHDPSEEDVARPVPRLWRRHREDRRESTAARRGKALVLTESPARCGAQVERSGDVGVPPRPASVARGSEPDVRRRLVVAEPVAAVVVPEDADGPVAGDGDGRLEGESGDAGDRPRPGPRAAVVGGRYELHR